MHASIEQARALIHAMTTTEPIPPPIAPYVKSRKTCTWVSPKYPGIEVDYLPDRQGADIVRITYKGVTLDEPLFQFIKEFDLLNDWSELEERMAGRHCNE